MLEGGGRQEGQQRANRPGSGHITSSRSTTITATGSSGGQPKAQATQEKRHSWRCGGIAARIRCAVRRFQHLRQGQDRADLGVRRVRPIDAGRGGVVKLRHLK